MAKTTHDSKIGLPAVGRWAGVALSQPDSARLGMVGPSTRVLYQDSPATTTRATRAIASIGCSESASHGVAALLSLHAMMLKSNTLSKIAGFWDLLTKKGQFSSYV